MPLSPLAAVAAEQSTNKGSGLASPNNKDTVNNTKSLSQNISLMASTSSSSSFSASTTVHTVLTDHDLLTQSRAELVERYTQFNWDDSSALLTTLSLPTYKYYYNFSTERKQKFQQTIHDRYMAAVDHALIRYTKAFQNSKDYKVFAKDINRLRLHIRSMVDENKIGGKLHIPTLVNHTLREWMIKDGLLNNEKNSGYGIIGNSGTESKNSSAVPPSWLPDTSSSSSSTTEGTTVVLSSIPTTTTDLRNSNSQRRNSIKDTSTLSAKVNYNFDTKHDTYQSIENWQNYPKDYNWSLIHRSQQNQQQNRSSSSFSTSNTSLPTSDEPTFWVGRTIGLGNIQTNFTGGGDKGNNTVRKKQDPTTMRSLWAAERGIITTVNNLNEGMTLALDKNELRMIDPSGANLASIMGPTESAEAYLDMAKHRWQREPAQLNTDSVHVQSHNSGTEFYDPLNVPLTSSSNVTIRSAMTDSVLGITMNTQSSSASVGSKSSLDRPDVSLASLGGRMAGNQMRNYLMEKTEAIIQKLQQAGALTDERSSMGHSLVPLDTTNDDNALIPYQNTVSASSSLPIGTRLAVQETVPGVTTRIMQPKEGVIAVSLDNLTDNKDTRNPLRDDATIELRDGKIESISYLPVIPTVTDPASSASLSESKDNIVTDSNGSPKVEQISALQSTSTSSRSLHSLHSSTVSVPKAIPVFESTDFSSFVTVQQNSKASYGPPLSGSSNSTKTTTKGRNGSVGSSSSSNLTGSVTLIPAPVYRDPQIARYLANAARPLPSVDQINIHAYNRIGPKKEGIERPSTPRTLNDSIDYRYPKLTSPIDTAPQTHGIGMHVSVPSLNSAKNDHSSSPRSFSSPHRPTQEPWYYKQGYSPGIALSPTNPSSTAALLGPVAAEKLRKEANVKDATEYLLHRVIGARAGASHRSRQISRNPNIAALYNGPNEESSNLPRKYKAKMVSPSPVEILQSFVNKGSSSIRLNPHEGSLNIEETSLYSNETDASSSSTIMLENALVRGDQRTQEQERILPLHHQTHDILLLNNNDDKNTLTTEIITNKVQDSLAELSSVLLKSQALPVSYATRVRGLGSLTASRPLPFKLSPIEPRKPLSLIKKGMYETMYTG